MSGVPNALTTYEKIVKAGFCYCFQKDKCDNGPSCKRGRHECYQCWLHDLVARHGCYTLKKNVCKTRSERFEHFAPRDKAIEFNSRTEDSLNETDYLDLNEQYSENSSSYGRRRGTAASREPSPSPVSRTDPLGRMDAYLDVILEDYLGVKKQYGVSRENFGAGVSTNHRENAREPSSAKRFRSDPTVSEEREELRMKIVQLEFDLKLEKEKVSMKEVVRQNEKENLVRRNEDLEKRNQELVERNQVLEKNIQGKDAEIEGKKKEILELQKGQDELKAEYSKEQLLWSNSVIDLRNTNQNLRQQNYQLAKSKSIGSGPNMNGAVFGSAHRNNGQGFGPPQRNSGQGFGPPQRNNNLVFNNAFGPGDPGPSGGQRLR